MKSLNTITTRRFLRMLAVPILLFTFLTVATPTPTFADGCVIRVDPYGNRFDYSNENNQDAYINYEDGMQRMILNVGIDEASDSDLVWIFPVPSDPGRITLDILTGLPELHGEEISGRAKSNLSSIWELLAATQIYPILGLGMMSKAGYSTLGEGNLSFGISDGTPGVNRDVVVHEHIDKEGVTSEIITARTANGLYDYLRGRGLHIETGAIPVFDQYVGKTFSFIVSWISEYRAGYASAPRWDYEPPVTTRMQRGVFVTFPTDDIYYPLLPTSVYGDRTVPATLRIFGHVTPMVFDNIRKYVTTEYFINGYYTSTANPDDFYHGGRSGFAYTRLVINAPSSSFTEDLWIRPTAPVGIFPALFVAKYPVLPGIALFLLGSILAALLAGWFMFPDLRKKPQTLMLIGLSNCLTLIAVIIATILATTSAVTDAATSKIQKLHQKGYYSRRTIAVWLFIYAVPALLFGLFILPQLFQDWHTIEFWYWLMLVLALYLLPTWSLIRAVDLMKVEPEDRSIFAELKEKGVPIWIVGPVANSKIGFIILFSLSFLLITRLLVELAKLIV